MCIKIVRTTEEFEFDPGQPLEQQVRGAKKVIIDYNPNDSRIDSFMDQIQRIIRTGTGCSMNIQVNPNNSLAGLRFERQLELFNRDLEINEVVSSLTQMHNNVYKKLSEIYDMCRGEAE